jgi:hypothetical protein
MGKKKQEFYDDNGLIQEIDEDTIRRFFPEAQFEFWKNHYVYVYYKGKKYIYKHHDNPGLSPQGFCHDCINHYVFFWFSEIHPWIMTIRSNRDYYFVMSTWDGTIPDMPLHSNETKEYETIGGLQDIFDYYDLRKKEKNILPFYHSKRYIGGFCRQINEPYALCILDPFFVETRGFQKYLENDWKEIGIPWQQKRNKIICRCAINNGRLFNFIDYETNEEQKQKGHRNYLYYHKKQEYMDILDMEKNRLTPREMSIFKYQLDIDGVTNSWGSLIWKLQSGSIVLKQESIWEQWYHYKLQPFVHYIPIANDFSNLRERYEWCESHPETCKEIIHNARQFAKHELTYENAIEEMKNHLRSYFELFDDL